MVALLLAIVAAKLALMGLWSRCVCCCRCSPSSSCICRCRCTCCLWWSFSGKSCCCSWLWNERASMLSIRVASVISEMFCWQGVWYCCPGQGVWKVLLLAASAAVVCNAVWLLLSWRSCCLWQNWFTLLEMKLPYDPVCPFVGRPVGWSVGQSWFPKMAGSFTSMLLSEHLLLISPIGHGERH